MADRRPHGSFLAGEAGELAGVPGTTIGQWARRGLIRSSVSDGEPRRYAVEDAAEASVVHALLERGVRHADIHAAIERLGTGPWPLQRRDPGDDHGAAPAGRVARRRRRLGPDQAGLAATRHADADARGAPAPGRRGLGGDGAGVLDVAAHLLDERVDRVEAPLAAQPPQEVDPQRLRRRCRPRSRCRKASISSPRPVTNVGRTPTFVAAACTAPSAVCARQAYTPWPGHDVAVAGHQVRRRVAERAPALVAVDDLARHRERLAEQLAGVLQGAAEHEPADVAGATRPRRRPPAAGRRASRSAPSARQQRRVALAPCARSGSSRRR